MVSANCNAFRFCCNALQGTGLKMKEIFVQQHGAKPHKVNDVPYFLNKYFHRTVITNPHSNNSMDLYVPVHPTYRVQLL
jgi:hypothetical protein